MAKLNFDLIKIGKDAENELYKAFEEAATEVRDTAKNKAPQRTGKLKESIKMKEKNYTNGSRSINVGPEVDYGFFVEVGANDKPPVPYMRRAFLEKRDKMARKMEKAAKDVIDKYNRTTN